MKPTAVFSKLGKSVQLWSRRGWGGGLAQGHKAPLGLAWSTPHGFMGTATIFGSSARNGNCGCFALYYKVGEILLGIQKEKPLTGGFFRLVLFFVYALFERGEVKTTHNTWKDDVQYFSTGV